jgi:hypothetical protein
MYGQCITGPGLLTLSEKFPAGLGIYYLMFATFPGKLNSCPFCVLHTNLCIVDLFRTVYGFSPGEGGLAYIGLGIGFILATIFGAKFADAVYQNVSLEISSRFQTPTDEMDSLPIEMGARGSQSSASRV